MRLHPDERGQTLILVALSLPIILGFIGMATDVGLLFMDKRQIQTAADAAAIAGALNHKYGGTTYIDAAKKAAAANGFTDTSLTGGTATVVVNDPPTFATSNYKGLSGYIEATVSKPESTIFLALFGHPSVTVSARAVATDQAPGSGCIYTVAPTGNGLTNNGTVDLEAPQCGLVIDSSDPGALTLHGTSGTLNLASIGIVGGDSISGHPSFPNAQPTTGVPPGSDPLSYLPQFSFSTSTTTTGSGKNKITTTTNTVACYSGYSCSNSPISVPTTCAYNATGKKGAVEYDVPAGATLSPGCYSSLTFPSSGTVTLNPGLYLVDGDITFDSGAVNGNGVSFYTNGAYSWGSGVYKLSAPNDTSQTFNGILYAESLDDTSGITFGGNATSVMKGVVYTPAASFNMHGNPSLTLYADFVVHDITLSGNVNLTSYQALSGVSDPLTAVALVE